MKNNEFRVLNLTESFELLPELDISRKIFCRSDDFYFFSSMLLPNSDIQVIIDDRINNRIVVVAKDCELTIDGFKIGFDFGDFEKNEMTVAVKYVIK